MKYVARLLVLICLLIASAAQAATTSTAYLNFVKSAPSLLYFWDVGNSGSNLVTGGASPLTLAGGGNTAVAITPYVSGYQPNGTGGLYTGTTLSDWATLQFGIGFWFTATTTGSDQCIVCNDSGTVNGVFIKLLATSGNIQFQWKGTNASLVATVTSGTNYGDGNPHYLFAVGTNASCGAPINALYIDAVAVGSCTGITTGAPTTALHISAGGQTGASLPLNGVVGAIELYSYSGTGINFPQMTILQVTQRYNCGLNNTMCSSPQPSCHGLGTLVWCDTFDSYTPYATLPSPWVTGNANHASSPYYVDSYYLSFNIAAVSATTTRPIAGSPVAAAMDADIYFVDPNCSSCGWTSAFIGFTNSAGGSNRFAYGGLCSAGVGFVGLQTQINGSNVGSCATITSNAFHHVNLSTVLNHTTGSLILTVDGAVVSTFTGNTSNVGATITNFSNTSQAIGGKTPAEASIDNLGIYAPPYVNGGPIFVGDD